jgi:hypothetical protein
LIQFHPVCEAFPQMDEAALGELAADIRKNGLREAIWRHRDGAILDGRNRYLACSRASVAPRYRTYEGPDSSLPAFVVSLNIQRRHLDESQRAMVAAKLSNLAQGRPEQKGKSAPLSPPPVTTAQAAKLLNVGERTVKSARAVQATAIPDVVKAVESGRVAVTAAAQIAKLPADQQPKALAEKTAKPKPSPKRRAESKPKGTDYELAIAEARAWMRKWAHLGGALVDVFDAITAAVERAERKDVSA